MDKQDRALFRPFNEVSDSATGWSLRVYCMGIRDIQRLVAMMSRSSILLKTFQTIRDNKGAQTELAQTLGSALIPFINDNALEILSGSVKFTKPEDATLDDLPHWALPTIIEQWVDINFKEPKQWLPWIEMMETLVKKLPAQEKKTTDSGSLTASNS